MEKVKMEVGEAPTVNIESIGGDLRLTGRNETHFEAQAPEKGSLSVEQEDNQISVNCRSRSAWVL